MSSVRLRLTSRQHSVLKAHLFPGDGLEGVALALCGRRAGTDQSVLVKTIVPIPYSDCRRSTDNVTWTTTRLVPLMTEAMENNLAILRIHSHPDGFPWFSTIDDESDAKIFSSVFSFTDTEDPHVSAIMLPGGKIVGRAVSSSGESVPLSCVAVVGDDLEFWYPTDARPPSPGFARRHAQLFGEGTTEKLRRLSIAVIGCSGTGSIVIEQLARLGVGRLVLVDPDRVEEKNLNRILNAGKEDAYLGRLKVQVMARAIARMGLGTEVRLIGENLFNPASVRAVSGCDVVFGCMDTAEGRDLLNRLATFYLLPYFDMGVRLDAGMEGKIDEVCGAVHYVQPEGSSLLQRGVYTLEHVKAEGLKRTNPEEYKAQLRDGYIRGVQEERPAVISVNMQIASIAVNEFLARLHPYRYDPNADFATVRTSFIQGETYREGDTDSSPAFDRYVGRGDLRPLLDMPALTEPIID
jgi:hypothetical protein